MMNVNREHIGTDDDVFTTTTMITMEYMNVGDNVYVNTKVRVTDLIHLNSSIL